ncbi:hypothetical protein [Vibrio misgurnus]|uniref:hypothetical protein n=1 Tax=Vibrio misgurnus TaxID=2993714 RepID=UPI0023F70C91|nr:hypothetical protein [Vibrio sp. VCS]
MNQRYAHFKSRKVVSALLTVLAALALLLGYHVSPDLSAALLQLTCELVECVE